MNKHIKHLYVFLLYGISFCLNNIISFCLNNIISFCLNIIISFCLNNIISFYLNIIISFCLNNIISFCINNICSMCDLNQKKHFIIRNTSYLTDEDRADIGRIISREGQILLLKQGSDGGSRINLDLLDERIINQIYSLVDYKINKLKG